VTALSRWAFFWFLHYANAANGIDFSTADTAVELWLRGLSP
jgi:hypothetical protein